VIFLDIRLLVTIESTQQKIAFMLVSQSGALRSAFIQALHIKPLDKN